MIELITDMNNDASDAKESFIASFENVSIMLMKKHTHIITKLSKLIIERRRHDRLIF